MCAVIRTSLAAVLIALLALPALAAVPDSTRVAPPWSKYRVPEFVPPAPAPVAEQPLDTTRTVLPWSEAHDWDVALARDDEPGPRFEMSGRVFGLDSLPAPGVKLYVYHADTKGWYAHRGQKFNRIANVLRTNDRGEYCVRSILPGMYAGPGHVYFEVWNGDHPVRGTYVALYAAPGVPPVPSWKYTRTATYEWNSHMGLITRDFAGVYHCRHDLWLGTMTPTAASYDSHIRVERKKIETERP
jgi:hypothetical protein